MQILPSGGANALPLAERQDRQDAPSSVARGEAPPAAPPAEAAASPAAADAQVSLGAREPPADALPPGRIYAEIWKDGVKLAQVDIHGRVISGAGVVMQGGGVLAGPLLAAQRAVQVAQQTGGEIRAAGQTVDGQTLLMRTRLASAYLS